MISISTDGDLTMAFRICGVMTRLEWMLDTDFAPVWFGFQQLYLVIKSEFEAAFHESFLSKLTKLIGYLRRQQNVVSHTRSELTKLCSVIWLSMIKDIYWLTLHENHVQENLV